MDQSDALSPDSDQSDVGIDEGDHDVPGAVGGGQTLVLVRQPARVHQHPAQPGGGHRALVAGEVHPAALATQRRRVSSVLPLRVHLSQGPDCTQQTA